MTADQLLPLLLATLRVSVPLLLAALAGLFSERSGIVDIGLEGKMLAGAFAAASVTVVSGDIWLGLLAAVAVSAALGLLHGYVCITQRGNQVVSGMAINILASGLTVTLGLAWFAQGGRTPPLPETARFGQFLGLPVLAFPAFALVPLSAWVLGRTRFGLRLRAVGENPAAVDTAGVSVAALRYRAVLIAGVLCGWAGAYVATAQGAGFVRDMTGGRGYLALAALILGKWRPLPTLAACLFFAAIDAVAIRLQGVALPGLGEVPVPVIQAIPYIVTVVLLAGFVGRAIPPRASGVPYVKER
jgi:simple sugar transport system permease protein